MVLEPARRYYYYYFVVFDFFIFKSRISFYGIPKVAARQERQGRHAGCDWVRTSGIRSSSRQEAQQY